RDAPFLLHAAIPFSPFHPLEDMLMIQCIGSSEMIKNRPYSVSLVVEQKIQLLCRHALHRPQHLPTHKTHHRNKRPDLRAISLLWPNDRQILVRIGRGNPSRGGNSTGGSKSNRRQQRKPGHTGAKRSHTL